MQRHHTQTVIHNEAMTRIAINIMTTIASIVATVTFMYFMFFYVFMNLGDWTFKYFNKFLTFQLTPIDHFLVQFTPLFFVYPIIKNKLSYSKELIKTTVLGICTLFLSILSGILLGILTWPHDESSPLLPEYIRVQPFGNYWTIFIIIGICVPFVMLIRKSKLNKTEILD